MEKHTAEQGNCTGSKQWSVLEEIAREGARKMLQQALEHEIAEYLEAHQDLRDESGKQVVVRNGYMPPRELVSGLGPIEIKQPRVDDRNVKQYGGTQRFSSSILPRYLRRVASVDSVVPALYLKGISTNDFPEALSAILGEGVKGLSATNIVRLKECWEQEYQQWRTRSLADKQYVYIWADGIYFNVRLDSERSCILVIMGADAEGNKELIAVTDGYRESSEGWRELLVNLKHRGLRYSPKLAVGDGALGFWKALDEVFPGTRRQRCWVHKTANILDKMPKSVQSKAKTMIHDMYQADTKKHAEEAYELFVKTFKDKYPKAVACLEKDEEDLFSFYDFPGVHWTHIRTTNPIESTFATVRLRTKQTKGCGNRDATLAMVFKLTLEAQKTWKRLKGYKSITLVMEDRTCVDGILQKVA